MTLKFHTHIEDIKWWVAGKKRKASFMCHCEDNVFRESSAVFPISYPPQALWEPSMELLWELDMRPYPMTETDTSNSVSVSDKNQQGQMGWLLKVEPYESVGHGIWVCKLWVCQEKAYVSDSHASHVGHTGDIETGRGQGWWRGTVSVYEFMHNNNLSRWTRDLGS